MIDGVKLIPVHQPEQMREPRVITPPGRRRIFKPLTKSQVGNLGKTRCCLL